MSKLTPDMTDQIISSLKEIEGKQQKPGEKIELIKDAHKAPTWKISWETSQDKQ
ncbi:hypothetical protein H0A36_20545 [Endozoicomonas sp. SM1973]|uniref:Uncharacterized protein n=1 Tax=Spartinivicinus marinus TaxID=2994442 RepID=A0A853I384_9GAMM|nr:hypothetical protein [Spartinivicinus marinus]MCX4028211.1 hypothetical protein [Spartinivicinus marinus]NYZ68410.1 hypothetical protein [Spartinivicinus marinus]